MGSTSKISRIETGERPATARDIRDLGRFYGITDREQDELQKLAIEARKKGWWADYRVHDEQAATYLGLETAASSTEMVENLRWPGPLQTPELTRALLSRLRPAGELSEQFIEDQITVRRMRRQRLTSGDLAYHAILDEAMFHRPYGPDIIKNQVAEIIDLNSLDNLIVQVVPFDVGVYPGLDGTFHILRFPHPGLDAIVFVEGLLGNHLVDRGSDVDHYALVFRSVAENSALDPDKSLTWLKRIHQTL
jgi:hypothetical protein